MKPKVSEETGLSGTRLRSNPVPARPTDHSPWWERPRREVTARLGATLQAAPRTRGRLRRDPVITKRTGSACKLALLAKYLRLFFPSPEDRFRYWAPPGVRRMQRAGLGEGRRDCAPWSVERGRRALPRNRVPASAPSPRAHERRDPGAGFPQDPSKLN